MKMSFDILSYYERILIKRGFLSKREYELKSDYEPIFELYLNWNTPI